MTVANKPAIVFPTLEQIPLYLHDKPRFIGFKFKAWNAAKQKWTKPPYSCLDGSAIGAVEKYKDHFLLPADAIIGGKKYDLDGLGVVALKGDGIILLDVDAGILADGSLDSVSGAWIPWFSGSYVEKSPSKTGWHAIFLGNLPGDKAITDANFPNSPAHLEIYSHDRFFTFTADKISDNLEITHAQSSLDKILEYFEISLPPSIRHENDPRPMPIATARRIHQENLAALRIAPEGTGNNELNLTAFFAGRAYKADALQGTEESIKQQLLDIVTKTWKNPHDVHGARQTIESGWNSAEPLNIQDPAREIQKVDLWLSDGTVTPPSCQDAVASLALCDPLDVSKRRKELSKRLGVSIPAMNKAITDKKREQSRAVNPLNDVPKDIRTTLANLLLSTGHERTKLGLPSSQESANQQAETEIWQYIKNNSQVFSTDSGQGYILLNDAKDKPIPVRKAGHELNDFLTGLGIHAGAQARDRIGKHLGAMCWREGVRVEPRVSFHYDKDACVAYFAEGAGSLIRLSASEITRVPNGTDGQLFLFPRDYEPWALDLENLPGLTDFCPDVDALLPKLLFSVLEFDNESLCADDLHVLLNAYVATLFLPGIVSGKLLLQVLGETGSAKTLFLRLLGRMIYGRRFEVTGMDTDEKEVENAVVNNSFVVFDDVKRTSNAAILGIIRRACTGAVCIRRELYSNFNEVKEPYRAAIAISCSDEPFTASDEMSNRSLIIRAKARQEYIEEPEFLQRIDLNRNQLMAEMMVRLQNVILAIKAQRNFKPTNIKHRMASFATFLMRVARHWDWGTSAQKVLDAWKEEQEGAGLDESIVTALIAWMANPKWENRHYGAGELHRGLVSAAYPNTPWWIGKEGALIKALRHASHAYNRHFGFCFTTRTSGHKPAQYWFQPKAGSIQGQESFQEKIPF